MLIIQKQGGCLTPTLKPPQPAISDKLLVIGAGGLSGTERLATFSFARRSNSPSSARFPNNRSMSRDRNCSRAGPNRTRICPEQSRKRERHPSLLHGL